MMEPEENDVTFRQSEFSVIVDAEIGQGTVVGDHVNLYKCKIGRNCKIDAYVYIEGDVLIGDNCKVRPFVFIPTGVTIEDDVFIGPSVAFTNDKYPKMGHSWELLPTKVKSGASIGANSTILPGITIGENSTIGAGSVVTKDVPSNAVVFGNPARIIRRTKAQRNSLPGHSGYSSNDRSGLARRY
jgi:acetyltransferase-like isoleucine patch superfamily enzyme